MLETTIPPSLEFVILNIKIIATTPLSVENYPIWKSQIFKLFKANSFESFLDGSSQCPPKHTTIFDGTLLPNPHYYTWQLIDQNIATALYSISSFILP